MSMSDASPHKATIIKAPTSLPTPLQTPSIFLSGFISPPETCWRNELSKSLAHLPITIINPLRRDWDNSWREHLEEPKFVEQVSWELKSLEQADIVVINFPSGIDTKGRQKEAPISLLELGFVTGRRKNVVVCCPEGYAKRGNVQLLGLKMGFTVVDNMEELVKQTLKTLEKHGVDVNSAT